MVETARVQYVFLDVVGFTKYRSAEDQSGVVATLNDVVTRAVQAMALPAKSIVLLPTGDGMAIALINVLGVDIHLRLALEILRLTIEHNSHTPGSMRRFEVRVGINENVDNIVLDINGRRNVAGAGVNMARRVMHEADAGQILVGQTVYDALRYREKYSLSFRAFTATAKHGATFPVYQFLSQDSPGLNVSVPSAFATQNTETLKYPKPPSAPHRTAPSTRVFSATRLQTERLPKR